MAVSDTYCLDTSALFDAGIRWYPPDIFPTFWEELGLLADNSRIIIPEMVANEATIQTHVVAQWVKDQRSSNPAIFFGLDSSVQTELQAITVSYPDWTSKGRNKADPFVVATAKAHGLIVVTGEIPSGSSPIATPTNQRKLKIPNVCDTEGIRWVGITDLIKEEGWKF
jgi:hypothetical protein